MEEHYMELDYLSEDLGAMPDILLVEDNPLHVRLVKSMLADIWDDSETLRFAKRLDRALQMVQEREPACVLLDLVLPDAEDLQAVKAMLAVAPQVPIVVLSSHEDDEMAMQAVREGAQDYLVKGTVGPEQLARAIHFAMQRHKMDRPETDDPELVVPEAESSGKLSSGIAVLDGEGTVVFAEPTVGEMLGLELSRIVGVPLAHLSYPSDNDAFREAAKRDGIAELNLRLRHASGNDLRVRIELTPLADGSQPNAAFIARYYPMAEVGTAASGAYTVFTEWSST